MENMTDRLSRITTLWTLVRQAHGCENDGKAALHTLMQRYAGAVHRYLVAAVKSVEQAEDLFQDFCLRFLRGDFGNAQSERGRFRDYVKTAIFHLIVDHQRRQARRGLPLDAEPASSTRADSELAFKESWRDELLDRAWLGLEEHERRTGQPHYSVLRLRTGQPTLSSEQLAEQIGAQLGRPYRVDAIRQALHRARDRFTELLLEEVRRSCPGMSAAEVEEELIDLGLHSYCRAALDRGRSC